MSVERVHAAGCGSDGLDWFCVPECPMQTIIKLTADLTAARAERDEAVAVADSAIAQMEFQLSLREEEPDRDDGPEDIEEYIEWLRARLSALGKPASEPSDAEQGGEQ